LNILIFDENLSGFGHGGGLVDAEGISAHHIAG
jgi:hypothetical protein